MIEMHEKSDAHLLRDYAEHGNEVAFRDLVTRHTDFVYSAAFRQVNSPDLARDVAQSVFTDLARKARPLAEKIPGEGSLAGWLHRGTRYAALNHLRDTRRRLANERQAMEEFLIHSESAPDWERIRPTLDEALDSLGDEDREALLLRYFKNHDFRAVGLALGVSDDAAQKRVSRAVERLREFFAKRGVSVGSIGLVVAISANAVHAAPVGLAVTISTAATFAGTTIATTAIKASAMTALQKTLISATIAALVGAGIYEARQAARLRSEKQALLAQQEQLAGERDNALSAAARNTAEVEQLRKDKNELLRLRGEVGVLRRQLSELETLQTQNRQLQTSVPKAGQDTPQTLEEQETAQWVRKMDDTRTLALAMIQYADRHQGQFPTNFNQAARYFEQTLRNRLKPGDIVPSETEIMQLTNRFDIVYGGSWNAPTNLAEAILVRQKQPEFRNGKWMKVYGFCDGSARGIAEPEGGFDAWEARHVIAVPNTNP